MNLLQNLYLALPQIIILITASLVLISTLFTKKNNKNIGYMIALLGLFMSMLVSVFYIGASDNVILNGEFISDTLGSVINAGIVACVAVVLIYSRDYILERQMSL